MKAERSAALAAVKLRGLLRQHLEQTISEPERFGSGAAVVHDNAAWVYMPGDESSLGIPLAWGHGAGVDLLNLIVDVDGHDLAFAAGGFAKPAPIVWRAEETSLNVVESTWPEAEPPPDECSEFTALLADAGLDVIADHGVWLGEVNGLEVARVGVSDGFCAIDIGVGAFDQFASAAIDADRSPADKLGDVIEIVRPHRIAGAQPHAIGRLVRARWLRAQAVAHPEHIGLDGLRPIPLLHPRPGLSENQPAAAIGERGSGKVLLIFAVGIDLRVGETAAGLARFHGVDEIVIAMPARDHHPRIVASLDSLARPAQLVVLEGEWSD